MQSEHVAYQGKGASFDEAVKNAWEKAPKREGQETTVEILQILVHGNNPISSYSIVVRPT